MKNSELGHKLNYFTFEAEMHEKMLGIIKPCFENQLADRMKLQEITLYFNQLSKRLQLVEACFNMDRGKHAVFDLINDK